MDVHCVACPAWIPIGEYVDESAPPVHPQCLAGGFEVPDEWRPAGLASLRQSAPQWFGSEGDIQRPAP